jgi:methionyl-tRNA synthetase
VPLGLDGDFSHERLVGRFNYDLANDLGNLVHRTVSMIHQLFEGVVPEELAVSDLDEALDERRRACIDKALEHYGRNEFSEALQTIWELIGEANKYIDEKKPWELKKRAERRDEVSTVFNRLIQVIRTVLILAYPVIPTAANRFWGLLEQPGTLEDLRLDALKFAIPAGTRLRISEPVFMRVDWAKKVAESESGAGPGLDPAQAAPAKDATAASKAPPASSPAPATSEGLISIDDFAKVQLRVGEIRSAARVEGADKLLHLAVFDGERERSILAGIAQYYEPESLIGKQVVMVANLAPRKLRGLMSEGMLLAAGGDSGKLALVSPELPVDPGVVVR